MTKKLYAHRDCEAMASHYTAHVSAMTSEGLHSKSAIAAELAHRDVVIDGLLEALRRIEGATMSMYATRSDMLEDCQDVARAAIAKVET